MSRRDILTVLNGSHSLAIANGSQTDQDKTQCPYLKRAAYLGSGRPALRPFIASSVHCRKLINYGTRGRRYCENLLFCSMDKGLHCGPVAILHEHVADRTAYSPNTSQCMYSLPGPYQGIQMLLQAGHACIGLRGWMGGLHPELVCLPCVYRSKVASVLCEQTPITSPLFISKT